MIKIHRIFRINSASKTFEARLHQIIVERLRRMSSKVTDMPMPLKTSAELTINK